MEDLSSGEFAEFRKPLSREEVRIYGDKDHYVVDARCVAPSGYNEDWTNTMDEDKWRYRSEKRNIMMRTCLKNDIPIQFVSGGKSLEPLVFSGDTCFLWPVTGRTEILPGDIVFCEVQPKGYFYTHLVWRTGTYRDPLTGIKQPYWVIGNNKEGDKSKMNGWVYLEHIHGILVKTQRGLYERKDKGDGK